MWLAAKAVELPLYARNPDVVGRPLRNGVSATARGAPCTWRRHAPGAAVCGLPNASVNNWLFTTGVVDPVVSVTMPLTSVPATEHEAGVVGDAPDAPG